MKKMNLYFLCLFLFLTSCNAFKVLGGGETKLGNEFFNNECSNCSEDESPICPADYLFVNANNSLGTNDFCVAKFEMKNAGGVASSQASLTPWTNISAVDAKSECQSLGLKYDLISNSEWLAIAQQIEENPSNWSGGAIGSGMIHRGHSDRDPEMALDVSNDSDFYDQTNNSSGDTVGDGWEQARTHMLLNGDIIWDFGGNVAEWVDWFAGSGFDLGPTTCAASWTEFNALSCAELSNAEFSPVDINYGSSQGFGKFIGGTGGAAQRGGSFSASTPVRYGIYGLTLQGTPFTAYTNIGFRCVYRF